MGAALGAKLAFPDRTVLNIAGDGCFRMNLNELITAVRYDTGLRVSKDTILVTTIVAIPAMIAVALLLA